MEPAATGGSNPWEDDSAWVKTHHPTIPPVWPDPTPPPPDIKPPRSSRARWFVIGGAAGLLGLAVAAVAILFMTSRGVDVPNVVGMQYSEARAAMASQEFTTVRRTDAYSDDVAEGLVIAQSPRAGDSVDPDTTVTLTVSQGPRRTDVRAIFDMGSFDGYLQTSLDCDVALTVFVTAFSRPVLVDETGDVVGRASTAGWRSSPSNGQYFPCRTEVLFTDVPVNRVSYQVELDPNDPNPSRSPRFSRESLQENRWVLEW